MLLAKCLIFQLKLEFKRNVPFFLTFWLTVGGVVNLKLTSARFYVCIQSTDLLHCILFLLAQHTVMETQARQKKNNFYSIIQFHTLLPCISSSHTGGSQSTSSQGSYQLFYLLFMFAPNTYAIGRGEFLKKELNKLLSLLTHGLHFPSASNIYFVPWVKYVPCFNRFCHDFSCFFLRSLWGGRRRHLSCQGWTGDWVIIILKLQESRLLNILKST